MARFNASPLTTGSMILLAWMMLVCNAPLHPQSTAPGAVPEPKPKVSPEAQESAQKSADAAEADLPVSASQEQLRQAQIEDDTKKLYQLSAELRAEVAKSYKESLSLTVLKKAEAVEMLAKSLRQLISKEAAAAKR